jgi:hypothetical protein
MTGANALEEAGGFGVGGRTAPTKVRVQLRIRQLENLLKPHEIRGIEVRTCRAQEGLQDRIELAHASTATPPQASKLVAHDA